MAPGRALDVYEPTASTRRAGGQRVRAMLYCVATQLSAASWAAILSRGWGNGWCSSCAVVVNSQHRAAALVLLRNMATLGIKEQYKPSCVLHFTPWTMVYTHALHSVPYHGYMKMARNDGEQQRTGRGLH